MVEVFDETARREISESVRWTQSAGLPRHPQSNQGDRACRGAIPMIIEVARADHLECRTYYRKEKGPEVLLVAKPPYLGQPASRKDVTFSYLSADGPGNERIATRGTVSETEYMIPDWAPGDIIFAIPLHDVFFTVENGPGVHGDVVYVAIGTDNRFWLTDGPTQQ